MSTKQVDFVQHCDQDGNLCLLTSQNGHDHNAQHINDGSNVEYITIGAGAPVDAVTTHEHTVQQQAGPSATKFNWARKDDERERCQTDPECESRFDSEIKDGSFANMIFKSATEAEVELISHHGMIM